LYYHVGVYKESGFLQIGIEVFRYLILQKGFEIDYLFAFFY